MSSTLRKIRAKQKLNKKLIKTESREIIHESYSQYAMFTVDTNMWNRGLQYSNSFAIRSTIYTVRQKKGTNFLLCASLLILDRNW